MMTIIVNETYVAAHGDICPFCGSVDLMWGEINVKGNEVLLDVSCDNCGKEWDAVYELVGFREK